MSTIIENSGSWYHVTSGAETVRWQEGGPRKGGSARQIGLVRFDPAAIAEALEDGDPPAASLRMTRDAAYGTGAVDVTVAPVLMQEAGLDDMDYQTALGLGIRDLHKTMAVVGDVCDYPMPGAWLDLIVRGLCNAWLIYREDGEGTDAELRLTDGTELVLYDAGTYKLPSWRRPIARGDIISDRLQSHIGDLREIQYYLNIRRGLQELEPVDIDVHDVGLYADWPAVIDTLRDGTDECIAAEGGDPVTWCVIDPDELPSAQAVNELRQVLSSFGPEEQISVEDFGYCRFEHLHTDFVVDRGYQARWTSGKAPQGGACWEYQMRLLNPEDTEKTKVKVFLRRFGLWMLADLIAGKTVNRLQLRVGRLEGEKTVREITMYGVLVAAIPAGRASVNQVIDPGLVMATGGGPVGGEVTFEFTAAGIAALQSGDYYGAAVDDKGAWTNYSAGATLIINGTEE